MRGPARTGRGGVSMAGGLEGQGARKAGKWGEGPLFAITTMFCSKFAYVFRLSVSIRKVASEYPFCVLIYMNSYIFHIYFILFIFLSSTMEYLIFDFTCLTLSLADTHGIAKYARTYIRRYTYAHTKSKNHVGKVEEKNGKKSGGNQGRKKEKNRGQKGKRGGKQKQKKRKRGKGEKKERERGIGFDQVYRSVGTENGRTSN